MRCKEAMGRRLSWLLSCVMSASAALRAHTSRYSQHLWLTSLSSSRTCSNRLWWLSNSRWSSIINSTSTSLSLSLSTSTLFLTLQRQSTTLCLEVWMNNTTSLRLSLSVQPFTSLRARVIILSRPPLLVKKVQIRMRKYWRSRIVTTYSMKATL